MVAPVNIRDCVTVVSFIIMWNGCIRVLTRSSELCLCRQQNFSELVTTWILHTHSFRRAWPHFFYDRSSTDGVKFLLLSGLSQSKSKQFLLVICPVSFMNTLWYQKWSLFSINTLQTQEKGMVYIKWQAITVCCQLSTEGLLRGAPAPRQNISNVAWNPSITIQKTNQVEL